MAQHIFERTEIKYLMSEEQYLKLRERMTGRITDDEYGLTHISSMYYDTQNYDIIRESLEKPVYKEKFRLRGYGQLSPDSMVYLELKKKYKGTVYKRRESLILADAEKFLETGIISQKDTQIMREIKYFFDYYKPQKRTLITCDRTAAYGVEDHNLRLTFDRNIRANFNPCGMLDNCLGEDVLEKGQCLMEIKALEAMPVWLAEWLSEMEIYPVSFSKYGKACLKHFG